MGLDMSEANLSELLGVISWNEKGFWQADVFNTNECEETPIWYCTGKIGDESQAVAEKVFAEFGNDLNVVLGYYGECEDCGNEKLMPETQCSECSGKVNSYA